MVAEGAIESPVVSEAARRWVHGDLDSRSYFDEAREAARIRAQVEVTLRLHGTSTLRRARVWREAAAGPWWAFSRRLT